MTSDALLERARRIVIRTAGIAVANVLSQAPRVFLMIEPTGIWQGVSILTEIGQAALALGLGVALALETQDADRWETRSMQRWLLLGAWTALAVVVSCAFVYTDVAMKLGLTVSEHALRLHVLWNNSVIALVAVAYLTRRRDTAQAERRRRAMELRLSQTRERLQSIAGQTAAARLEPQTLLDCMSRARDVYPVDMARGDALLDSLVHYLRMTLGSGPAGASTLKQAAERAAARVDVERCESDAPMDVDLRGDVGKAHFPLDLLAPLACEWLRAPGATAPRALRLAASSDAKGLSVSLQGPCPVPADALRRATQVLAAFAARRATVTADQDNLRMEIAHV